MAEVIPHLARFLKGQELPVQHLVAMFKILVDGPQSVAAIATEVGLTQTAASRMVDKMVRAGLVDRTENPDDRRRKRLTLTKKGETLLEELPVVTIRVYEDILSALPGDVIADLSAPLAALCRALPEPPRPLRAARDDAVPAMASGGVGDR
nr:MarR family transcriptional regulator [Jiella sonneratiae]